VLPIEPRLPEVELPLARLLLRRALPEVELPLVEPEVLLIEPEPEPEPEVVPIEPEVLPLVEPEVVPVVEPAVLPLVEPEVPPVVEPVVVCAKATLEVSPKPSRNAAARSDMETCFFIDTEREK
jgi:hypothetical protein